jgi:hypothetical protein
MNDLLIDGRSGQGEGSWHMTSDTISLQRCAPATPRTDARSADLADRRRYGPFSVAFSGTATAQRLGTHATTRRRTIHAQASTPITLVLVSGYASAWAVPRPIFCKASRTWTSDEPKQADKQRMRADQLRGGARVWGIHRYCLGGCLGLSLAGEQPLTHDGDMRVRRMSKLIALG